MKLLKFKEKKDLINITKLFIISRILIIIIFIIFSLPLNINKTIYHFDIEHYYNIGVRGYTFDYQYAFFPLLPLLISFFNYLRIPILGTILFNLTISYLTTVLIYIIIKEFYFYEDKLVENIIRFWIFSPVALFTIIPYTEGLFLFLTILTFYLYKQKKHPIIMGIVLGLSVACRSFGAMLFFSIFIVLVFDLCKEDMFNFKKNIRYIIYIYIPATFISCLYPLFLFFKKDNFFYFIEVQFSQWSRVKSNFFTMMIKEFNMFKEKGPFTYLYVLNIIILFIVLSYTIYFFINSIKNKHKDRFLLNLYTLLCVISCFSTMRYNSLMMPSCSIYRYLLSLFPLYIYPKEKKTLFISKILFILINFIVISSFALNIFLC